MKFWFDFHYALRLLARRPGFTAITVAIMACGLGLCIFAASFLWATMLKPLDFPGGERMVVIDLEMNGVLHNGGQVNYSLFQDVRDQNNSFEIFGYMQEDILTVSGGDNAVSYRGVWSTPELFKYTSAKPVKGRLFNNQDDAPGANPVAVIGYDLWQDYFNGRQDIIGQRIDINQVNTEIVGVMPDKFLFPRASQLWLPAQFDDATYTRESGPVVQVYGLLKPGVTIDQANADMAAIVKRTQQQYPKIYNGENLMANTFMISMMGNGTKQLVVVMLSAVFLVLLLACINVANLLYARSAERAKETAIRVALGAPQSRLVMQMLYESLVICSLGGVFAILMAAWGLETSSKIMPSFISGRAPFWWEIQLDSSLVWVTLALVIVTTLITGILPARKIINGDFNAVLRDGTRGAQSRKSKRVSQALVILEVALSVALLTAASVMNKAVTIAMDMDYGAKTDEMMTVRMVLPRETYDTPEKILNYYQTLENDLANLPGVDGVAMMSRLPAQTTSYRPVLAEGVELAEGAVAPRASTVEVLPGAMETLEYRLLKGRFISDSDTRDSDRVVVVTQSFADKHWPGQSDVIGKRIRWTDRTNGSWFRVVGVVGHVVHGQPFSDFKYRPAVYRSQLQTAVPYMSIAISTNGDANKLRKPMLDTIDALDGNVPPYRVKTMEQVVSRNTAGIRFVVSIFTLFGICATVLAGSGIYALMSNAITQRTQELGIRRALGVPDNKVMGMLMRQGISQLVIGAAIGLPLAFMFSQLVTNIIGVPGSSLYGVFAAVPLFITVIVLLATWIPSLKAIQLEPNVALRYE